MVSKVFNGKKYYFHARRDTKSEALKKAKEAKYSGWTVRIIKVDYAWMKAKGIKPYYNIYVRDIYSKK